jgi:hypothetical protein
VRLQESSELVLFNTLDVHGRVGSSNVAAQSFTQMEHLGAPVVQSKVQRRNQTILSRFV